MPKLPFNPAFMLDDEGNYRHATGGLSDAIWGGQAADNYDRQRRGNYFNALTASPRSALSAAIGGAPKPTGVLAGPGWKNRSGLMRSLMLGAQAQGRDMEVAPFGSPQQPMPKAQPWGLSPGLADWQPQSAGPEPNPDFDGAKFQMNNLQGLLANLRKRIG